jgi:hypothetical protein
MDTIRIKVLQVKFEQIQCTVLAFSKIKKHSGPVQTRNYLLASLYLSFFSPIPLFFAKAAPPHPPLAARSLKVLSDDDLCVRVSIADGDDRR